MEDIFDFINLDQNLELFGKGNKKLIGKFKLETPQNIWIDEFVCVRNKMYSSECGDDSKTKIKSVSKFQSKRIKIEEYKNCLDEKKYQEECENYILRSVNHKKYLQQKKSALSIFDDKRCYINETESKPWI